MQNINIKIKNIFFFFFKLIIAFASLVYILKNYELNFNYLLKLNIYQVTLSFLFLLTNLYFASLRISKICKHNNLFFFIQINWVSSFVNTIFPNIIGADALRGVYLKNKFFFDLKKIFKVILNDRLIGFSSLLFFLIFIFIYKIDFYIVLYIIFFLFLYNLIKFFNDKISFLKFEVSFNLIVISLLSNLSMIFHLIVLFNYDQIIEFNLRLVGVLSLFIILNSISLTPNGIGITEIIMLKLFNNNLEYINFIEIFLISRVMFILFSLIGIFFFIKLKFKN